MKDIMGQELAVGNMVVFNPPRYKGLTIGTIVKFSPKMVTVEYKPSWVRQLDALKTSVYPTDLMKVDEQLQVIHLLKS